MFSSVAGARNEPLKNCPLPPPKTSSSSKANCCKFFPLMAEADSSNAVPPNAIRHDWVCVRTGI